MEKTEKVTKYEICYCGELTSHRSGFCCTKCEDQYKNAMESVDRRKQIFPVEVNRPKEYIPEYSISIPSNNNKFKNSDYY